MKTNARSTSAVVRNLSKPTKSDAWTEVWERLPLRTAEEFRDAARRYLGDASNLRKVTLDSADWDEVYQHFKGMDESQV